MAIRLLTSTLVAITKNFSLRKNLPNIRRRETGEMIKKLTIHGMSKKCTGLKFQISKGASCRVLKKDLQQETLYLRASTSSPPERGPEDTE
jgi:hypothetical protein